MIYLDWAATSIPDRNILQKALDKTTKLYGNPSSEHSMGRETRTLLIKSRNTWAKFLDCSPSRIIFTSGGTEGNNLVLQNLLQYKKSPHAVISGIEHASIYEPLVAYRSLGVEISGVSPDENGIISPEDFASAITDRTRFVSIIAVHNETGAVQPLHDIIEAVRNREKTLKAPIHIHIDAVQALGKIPFLCSAYEIDSAVFSSHKISGPKGAGALYLRKPISALAKGGEQEFGVRPGTENIFAIYGSSLAIEKAVENLEQNHENAKRLMELLISEICTSGCGEPFYTSMSGSYSPFINTFFFPPLPGEAAVRAFSKNGIALGTGSACSASKEKRIRGLKSMGLPPEKYESAVRISTGPSTSKDDIRKTVQVLQEKILPLVNALKNPLQ